MQTENQTEETSLINLEKIKNFVSVLADMTNEDLMYTFENLNLEGLINLNYVVSCALMQKMQYAKEDVKQESYQ